MEISSILEILGFEDSIFVACSRCDFHDIPLEREWKEVDNRQQIYESTH
jgi:hypothetical protein